MCLELEAEARADAVMRVLGYRYKADLGALALVMAALAGCRNDWERGLRGWNMKTSPFLDENLITTF